MDPQINLLWQEDYGQEVEKTEEIYEGDYYGYLDKIDNKKLLVTYPVTYIAIGFIMFRGSGMYPQPFACLTDAN